MSNRSVSFIQCQQNSTSTSGVTYDEMVEYVDARIYSEIIASGVIDTTTSGRLDCWEQYFTGLQVFDNMSFDYPSISGTDYYYNGGTF